MSERRNSKPRKKGLQNAATSDIQPVPGISEPIGNVTTNVIIQNCKFIQIGEKNNITVTLPETATEDHPFDLDKELYFSYLNVQTKEGNNSDEVSTQALETTFLKRQKTQKKHLSFKHLYKQKLLPYLRSRGELYILNKHGDHWTVKPTKQATEKFFPNKTSETEEAEKVDVYSVSNSEKSCIPSEKKSCYKAHTSAAHSEVKDTSKGAIPKNCGTARTHSPIPTVNSQEDTKIDQHDLRPQHIFTHPSEEIEKLMTAAKHFRQGHYILIHCEQKRFSYLESLSLIPWLAVFDFDQNSINSGLLSVVDSRIKKMKDLNVSTWKDQYRFTEGSVQWCFMRGCPDMPESLLDSETLRWSKDYQASVELCLERLENFIIDYTNLTLLILWPEEKKVGNLTDHMYRFISRLDESLEPVSVILCDCGRIANSMSFNMLRKQLNKQTLEIIHLDLERICRALLSELNNRIEKPAVSHKLPAENGTGDAIITDENAAWLKSEFEVLYLKSPYHTAMDLDELKRESENFLRGGTIAWPVRYECRSEHLDAERDLLQTMVQKVRNCAGNFKSETIVLSHAPGSGGTTFSQRLLWELKESFPCVQARLHTGTPISELISRIEFLGKETRLPVVLLLDGEENQRVKNLPRMVRDVCLVILFVERYPYSIEEKQSFGSQFWLKGRVSQSEADMLYLKFQAHCEEERKKWALQELRKGVTLGKTHCVYEFGLTAYKHEYRGVQSFVRGYLQLDKNLTTDLLPWQTVLGYLSLAYYYGQLSMPCQFFREKLKLPPNTTVTIVNFEYPMREFIVHDMNEAKNNMIRICHFVIAKEILEQILTRHRPLSAKESSEKLSKDARSNLHSFAMEFIEYASKSKKKAAMSPDTVSEILTQIFIIRNNSYNEDQDAEFRSEHKSKLSQMMSDIECSKPYTERLDVFKKLTECFPNNPSFHAHLGRFYALYRRYNVHDEEKAMKCFNKALSLCKDELAKKVEAVEDQVKDILKHVYHMYGMMYFWRISQYTGKCYGDKPECRTTEAQFENRVEELRQMAQTACGHFADSRLYCPKSAFDSYGYCGEINVRLQLSDFTKRQIKQSLIEFIHSDKDKLSNLKSFIRESISEISDLIRECLDNQETTKIDPLLYSCIQWYEGLFRMKALDIRHFIVPNTIENRRLKIAARKLMHTKTFHRTSLESVTSQSDITEIVEDYDVLFHDIHYRGFECSLKSLDMDYKEWIVGIRHDLYKKDREIEEVLMHIKQWNSKVNSLYSRYYLFIIYALLGLGPDGTGGNKDMMKLAIEVQQELRTMSRTLMHSKYPWEWYGKGDRIKSLVNGNRFYGQLEGRTLVGSDVLPREDTTRLVVMKGTICKPITNKTLGVINLDMERNTLPVTVAFVPIQSNLCRGGHVGDRVEFLLGFSFVHGFEAFNVKILQRYNCTKCDLPVEFKSDESFHKCGECGENVYRTDAMV